MRYAGLMKNDPVDGQGFCVSFWTQGCPHRCEGCHNPETWSFDGGEEKPLNELINEIIEAIGANGIERNFSVLGGEPYCEENVAEVYMILKAVREAYPNIKIFVWTGYTIEELGYMALQSLEYVDVLVDGRFILEKRDVSQPMKGSTNQRVIDIQKSAELGEITLWEQ